MLISIATSIKQVCIPEISVLLALGDVVDEHAGERRADHASDGGVDPLQAVVGLVLPQGGDDGALEHGERRAADDADEHAHSHVEPEGEHRVVDAVPLQVRADVATRRRRQAKRPARAQVDADCRHRHHQVAQRQRVLALERRVSRQQLEQRGVRTEIFNFVNFT